MRPFARSEGKEIKSERNSKKFEKQLKKNT